MSLHEQRARRTCPVIDVHTRLLRRAHVKIRNYKCLHKLLRAVTLRVVQPCVCCLFIYCLSPWIFSLANWIIYGETTTFMYCTWHKMRAREEPSRQEAAGDSDANHVLYMRACIYLMRWGDRADAQAHERRSGALMDVDDDHSVGVFFVCVSRCHSTAQRCAKWMFQCSAFCTTSIKKTGFITQIHAHTHTRLLNHKQILVCVKIYYLVKTW